MLDFLSISFIILLGVISPGPDFAIVTRNTLRYSRKTGILTTFGISIGTLFHASYCIFGFALVISKSLLVFNIIKYIGAGYLIYLGLKGVLEKKSSNLVLSEEARKFVISPFQAFRQGLFCNVLNPKTILFFLALFTMMIKPSMPIPIQFLYAIEIAAIHFLWFSLITIFFSTTQVKDFLGQFLHYITKTLSGFLILFGIKMAAFSQN